MAGRRTLKVQVLLALPSVRLASFPAASHGRRSAHGRIDTQERHLSSGATAFGQEGDSGHVEGPASLSLFEPL